MKISTACKIEFVRLSQISAADIAVHMNDPRVARHMPLLTRAWDAGTAADFIAAKEEFWDRDGLGHWAFLCDGAYAGWGGFQKENDEWDFGLVLKPKHFGLGMRIAKQALAFARGDERIPYVTFLLAPSRVHRRGLERLGAENVGDTEYDGVPFVKYRLDTA